MWSVYLDTHPVRMVSTALLGHASRRAHYGPLAPLRARKLSRPALPGGRWVRVRNHVAGIADADLQLVHQDMDPRVAALAAPRPTRIFLGREVVGEVTNTGPGVQFLRPGDRVAFQSDQWCATREIEPPCRQCSIGNYALCENRYLPGPQAVGGGWSDEMVVHEQQLFLVPDGLADEQAALLEPAAAAVHAALRRLPQPGDIVLVIGADTAGLLTAQAVHALGPEGTTIAILAQHPFQVELAARMGAEHVLFDEDLSAAVARLTGAQRLQGRAGNELMLGGVDIVYDTIGTAATLQNALRWTRAGGAVVLTGGRLESMQVDLTPIWFQEVDLIGAMAHGAENAPGTRAAAALGRESTFQLAARLVRERRLTPERLITHRFPLREVRRAVETARDMAEHRAIKVMLDMRDPTGLDLPDAEILTEEETD